MSVSPITVSIIRADLEMYASRRKAELVSPSTFSLLEFEEYVFTKDR